MTSLEIISSIPSLLYNLTEIVSSECLSIQLSDDPTKEYHKRFLLPWRGGSKPVEVSRILFRQAVNRDTRGPGRDGRDPIVSLHVQ
jgi:hypothetical protein